eukprot:COSAG02_NODE_58548_length_277_cov_0.573034_1_plen_38_part_01
MYELLLTYPASKFSSYLGTSTHTVEFHNCTQFQHCYGT